MKRRTSVVILAWLLSVLIGCGKHNSPPSLSTTSSQPSSSQTVSVAAAAQFQGSVELVAQANHQFVISDIEFSQDSRLVATSCFDGEVKIWDTESLQVIRNLSGCRCDFVTPTTVILRRDDKDPVNEKTIQIIDLVTGQSKSREAADYLVEDGNAELVKVVGRSIEVSQFDTESPIRAVRIPSTEPVSDFRSEQTIIRFGSKTGGYLEADPSGRIRDSSFDMTPWQDSMSSGEIGKVVKLPAVPKSLRLASGEQPVAPTIASRVHTWLNAVKRYEDEETSAVAVSADRRYIAFAQFAPGTNHTSAEPRGLYLIDLLSGRLHGRLTGGSVYDGCVSHDGNSLALRDNANGIVSVWDLSQCRLESMGGLDEDYFTVRGPLPDSVARSKPATSLHRADLGDYYHQSDEILLSNNGKFFAVTTVPGVAIFDTARWKRRSLLENGSQSSEAGRVWRLTASDDWSVMVASGAPDDPNAGSSALLWQTESFSKTTVSHRLLNDYGSAISPDGKSVAANGQIAPVDSNGPAVHLQLTQKEARVGAWYTFVGPDYVAVEPASDSPADQEEDSVTFLFDTKTGRRVRRLEDGTAPPIWFGQGRTLEEDGIHEAASGTLVQSLKGMAKPIAPVAEGRMVSGIDDANQGALWDAASGELLCHLYSWPDGSWAVVDPVGRYDASDGGDIKNLHWVFGVEPIELAQFRNFYYTKGLLQVIVNGKTASLPLVPDLKRAALYPTWDAQIAGDTGHVTLKNRGGGIGLTRVLLNGREIAAFNLDLTHPDFDPAAARKDLTVSLAGLPRRGDGTDKITVLVWNRDGTVRSRGPVMPDERVARTEHNSRPHYYAVIAGAESYRSDAIKLNYAASDAVDMARAIKIAAGGIPGVVPHIDLLCDSPQAKAMDGKGFRVLDPTKDSFEKVFGELAKPGLIKPEDILLIYLTGHGLALQMDRKVYLYLTSDASTLDEAAYRFPDVRNKCAVSDDDLTRYLRAIAADKKVVILDTCAAGAVSDRAASMKLKGSEADAAVVAADLHDRTGLHVLMASAPELPAYESPTYGHGFMTYALLWTLRNKRLGDDRAQDAVDVRRLFDEVVTAVPILAKGNSAFQRPETISPAGSDFPIGYLDGKTRSDIPLETGLPTLRLVPFVNEAASSVDEELTDLVQDALKAKYGTVSSRRSAAVFVSSGPDAITVTGHYRASKNGYDFTIEMGKGAKTIRTTLSGSSKQDAAAAITAFVDRSLIKFH